MREFAISQTGSWVNQRAAECLLALALAPAFAWISPFGTDDQAFLTRLGYWGGMISCWFLTMAIVGHIMDTRGVLRGARASWRGIAKVGASAFPMIAVVAPATSALSGWQASVSEVTELYFQIALLGGGLSLMSHAALAPRLDAPGGAHGPALLSPSPAPPLASAVEPASHAGAGTPDSPQARPPAGIPDGTTDAGASRLTMRLPPAIRGPLLALEMEDHYVRVHTRHGSALVLLRLGDAIAETAPAPGRQVHRSWWVADAAVERFTKVGRAGQVRLVNGLTAPVSQRYLKDFEEGPAPGGPLPPVAGRRSPGGE